MPGETGIQRAQLMSRVDSLIKEYPSESFVRNWAFYKAGLDIHDIRGFHVKIIPSMNYINVSVVGEGLLVDVDGCEDSSFKSVIAIPLSMIRSLNFYMEPLESLPITAGSTLVVTVRLTGTAPQGPYWPAVDEEEEKDLLAFVKVLRKEMGQLSEPAT